MLGCEPNGYYFYKLAAKSLNLVYSHTHARRKYVIWWNQLSSPTSHPWNYELWFSAFVHICLLFKFQSVWIEYNFLYILSMSIHGGMTREHFHLKFWGPRCRVELLFKKKKKNLPYLHIQLWYVWEASIDLYLSVFV